MPNLAMLSPPLTPLPPLALSGNAVTAAHAASTSCLIWQRHHRRSRSRPLPLAIIGTSRQPQPCTFACLLWQRRALQPQPFIVTCHLWQRRLSLPFSASLPPQLVPSSSPLPSFCSSPLMFLHFQHQPVAAAPASFFPCRLWCLSVSHRCIPSLLTVAKCIQPL